VKKKVLWAVGALAVGASVIVGGTLWAKQGGGAAPAAPTTPAASAAHPVQTKIAFINLAYVLKNYKKVDALTEQFKKEYEVYEKQAKPKQAEIDRLKTENADPKTPADKKEANVEAIKKLNFEIDALNTQARKALAPKSEANTVAIYRDIQETAMKTALGRGFEMVLQFQDGFTPEDYNSPMNIMNKMQTRACIPIWYQQGNDISYDVVNTLNETYAKAATPTAAPGTAPAGH
jgi:Skp family chaperone for outer membrane proteins